jgi:hypothetical protein
MLGFQATLSPSEEVTLRRTALDAVASQSPEHIRRLASLKLIEADGRTWRLTPLGRQRYDAMPQPAWSKPGQHLSFDCILSLEKEQNLPSSRPITSTTQKR